ncbi:MAG: hypothetical protein H0V72_12045 [Bradyrhizobium sp.]|nr:hypothetical protein [Bradyrhizobium sp.]
MNPTSNQTDCGSCEGLFQPPLAFRNRPIKYRQQGLGLAEFRRSLVTDTVDGPHQEPKADFL